MTSKHQVQPSTSKYLELILRLEGEKDTARVKDIACGLGLLKGSVSAALKNLKAQGLVDYKPYQPIRLTAAGREMAENAAGRIQIVTQFLTVVLGMDAEDSRTAARRMEPFVEDLVVERMWHHLRQQYPQIVLPSTNLRPMV